MESGKLDEELSRMSEIADHITADCMILFNESFAATNEREGSEIARQIVSALLERRVRVFFVTHLYEFARGFHAQKLKDALFLRAERQPDGSRTFKLHEGTPFKGVNGLELVMNKGQMHQRSFLGISGDIGFEIGHTPLHLYRRWGVSR